MPLFPSSSCRWRRCVASSLVVLAFLAASTVFAGDRMSLKLEKGRELAFRRAFGSRGAVSAKKHWDFAVRVVDVSKDGGTELRVKILDVVLERAGLPEHRVLENKAFARAARGLTFTVFLSDGLVRIVEPRRLDIFVAPEDRRLPPTRQQRAYSQAYSLVGGYLPQFLGLGLHDKDLTPGCKLAGKPDETESFLDSFRVGKTRTTSTGSRRVRFGHDDRYVFRGSKTVDGVDCFEFENDRDRKLREVPPPALTKELAKRLPGRFSGGFKRDPERLKRPTSRVVNMRQRRILPKERFLYSKSDGCLISSEIVAKTEKEKEEDLATEIKFLEELAGRPLSAEGRARMRSQGGRMRRTPATLRRIAVPKRAFSKKED